MKTKTSLAIIIPVYNEIESLKHLVDEIHLSLKNYQNYSILFIDDGSTDGSFEFLKNIIKSDSKIHLIQFSINKGKSAALNEGFKWVQSDYIVTMDADLQDDPSEILNLLKKLDQGFDLVSGWKKRETTQFQKQFPQEFLILQQVFLLVLKFMILIAD